MQKKLKRLISFALVLVFAVTALSVTSLAAESAGFDIQYNGKIIDYPSGVAPVSENNRIFVPVKDVFELFGFTLEYDADTGNATAVNGDTTISFNTGSADFVVTNAAGETKTVTGDVLPISRNNRLLVPLKYVSECVGVQVAWDGAAKTAVIIDATAFPADANTYAELDKLINTKVDLTGNTKLTQKDSIIITADDTTVPVTLDLEVLVSDKAISGDVTIAIVDSGAEIQFKAEIIADLEKGFCALKSDALNTLLQIDEGTWLTLDTSDPAVKAQLDALVESLGIDPALLTGDAAAANVPSITNAKELVSYIEAAIVSSIPVSSVTDYESITTALTLFRDLLGDKSLKYSETKDSVTVTISYENKDLGIKYDLEQVTSATTQVPLKELPAGAKTAGLLDVLGLLLGLN